MQKCKKIVTLKDTDATGVLYFTSLLQYGLEAFELFLQSQHLPLSLLLSKNYLFPVVHAEADYKAPLFAGDEISLHLTLLEIKNRSFILKTEILKQGLLVGTTKIAHAFVQKGQTKASKLPEEFLLLLHRLHS